MLINKIKNLNENKINQIILSLQKKYFEEFNLDFLNKLTKEQKILFIELILSKTEEERDVVRNKVHKWLIEEKNNIQSLWRNINKLTLNLKEERERKEEDIEWLLENIFLDN